MVQLDFEANITNRWQDSKEQYRELFWEDIHQQVLKQVKHLMQDILQAQFDTLLGAGPYQRIDSRKSNRNGYYARSLETRYGRIEDIRVPRSRSLDVRFSLFDPWQQVDSNVLDSMLQAYLLGRSASCAQKIIQAFDHSLFSRGFLQRLTRRFEDNLQTWLKRPIDKPWPYLFLDGMVVDIKEISYKKRCVFWALGMDENRNTQVLGFLVLKTESRMGVQRLLMDLVRRGLSTPKLIISDDSAAIRQAAAMVFPHCLQQLCIFHKVKATGRYIRHIKNRQPFLRQAADIYLKASSRQSIQHRLTSFVKRWRHKEPRALRCLLKDFDQSATYLLFPKHHRSWIRTNNPLERHIAAVREWTSRFGYFQGVGNLYTAMFTYLCNKEPGLVPDLNLHVSNQKNTLLVA